LKENLVTQIPPPPPGPQQPGSYGDAKAQAKAAKAYAKAQRPWYKKKRWIGLIVLVVIIAISAASGGGSDDKGDKDAEDKTPTSSESPTETAKPDDKKSDEPKAEETKAEEPEPETKKFDVKTQAVAMVSEFSENELAADAKYKDKVIKVTGIISKIDTEIFDDKDYVLKLKGDAYDLLTVDCFDISNDELSKLAPGQTVSMIGDFKDGGDLGVELNHCSLA
jgi:hypothetical protein